MFFLHKVLKVMNSISIFLPLIVITISSININISSYLKLRRLIKNIKKINYHFKMLNYSGLSAYNAINIPTMGSGKKLKIKQILNKFINSLIIIINLRKSIFKGKNILLLITIIIGIFCSFAIRFDFILNFLDNLSLTNKIIILIISASYSSYLILLTIYNIYQLKLFYNYFNKLKINIKSENKYISIGYYFFTIFLTYVSIIITYINYLYILKLNIIFLLYLFAYFLIISVLFAIDFILHNKNTEFNLALNKVSNFNKLITKLYLLYLFVFSILFKLNIFSNLLPIKAIHCQPDDNLKLPTFTSPSLPESNHQSGIVNSGNNTGTGSTIINSQNSFNIQGSPQLVAQQLNNSPTGVGLSKNETNTLPVETPGKLNINDNLGNSSQSILTDNLTDNLSSSIVSDTTSYNSKSTLQPGNEANFTSHSNNPIIKIARTTTTTTTTTEVSLKLPDTIYKTKLPITTSNNKLIPNSKNSSYEVINNLPLQKIKNLSLENLNIKDNNLQMVNNTNTAELELENSIMPRRSDSLENLLLPDNNLEAFSSSNNIKVKFNLNNIFDYEKAFKEVSSTYRMNSSKFDYTPYNLPNPEPGNLLYYPILNPNIHLKVLELKAKFYNIDTDSINESIDNQSTSKGKNKFIKKTKSFLNKIKFTNNNNNNQTIVNDFDYLYDIKKYIGNLWFEPANTPYMFKRYNTIIYHVLYDKPNSKWLPFDEDLMISLIKTKNLKFNIIEYQVDHSNHKCIWFIINEPDLKGLIAFFKYNKFNNTTNEIKEVYDYLYFNTFNVTNIFEEFNKNYFIYFNSKKLFFPASQVKIIKENLMRSIVEYLHSSKFQDFNIIKK
jgi:hypothetical protein